MNRKMPKDYCPKENLINLINGILVFENLDREPGIGKKYTVMIGDMTLEEFLKSEGIGSHEEYQLEIQNYAKRENTLSELYTFGSTKEDIFKELKNHVKTCQDCSNRYLEYITMRANGLIGLKNLKYDDTAIQIAIKRGREFAKQGLFALLKKEDKVFLSLLDQK